MLPATIMSTGFVVAFGVLADQASDPIFASIAGLGIVSSAWRLSVTLAGRAEAVPTELAIERARQLERRFAIAYYQFAVLFGGATAYAIWTAPPGSHILLVCLVVGYGAGAALTTGLRPRIAIPSMLIGIAPAIVALAMRAELMSVLTSVLMAALLAGGILSLLKRYRIASSQIGRRLIFEGLARHDSLTALPNRLALREWFDVHIGL